ncbi:MAG: response regulator [Flavobacteriaceae bacterium]|nr:MAG: response regulator [Flavobacteriaceae bacterium]
MKKLRILLIEDDEIERMKFKRVCTKNGFEHIIVEAPNGEIALHLLDSNKLPDFILLDLNMPKMNGTEFLKSLKANPALQFIPIVVLSTSNNYEDVKKCYEIGASGYMIKPLHFEDYKQKVISLLNYWENNELIEE